MFIFHLGLYAGIPIAANEAMGVASANESEYRSKTVIFGGQTSLGGLEDVWWRWHASQTMRFCMIFRIRSLRFAGLVQAGEEM